MSYTQSSCSPPTQNHIASYVKAFIQECYQGEGGNSDVCQIKGEEGHNYGSTSLTYVQCYVHSNTYPFEEI